MAAERQLVQAGHADAPVCGQGLLQRPGHPWTEIRSADETLRRHEHQPESDVPSGADEAPIATAGVGNDPQPRLACQGAERPAKGLPRPFIIDGSAGGEADHRDESELLAAVAIGAQDRLVGLVGLLAGQRELLRQPAGHVTCRDRARQQHRQPEQSDEQLVPQHEP